MELKSKVKEAISADDEGDREDAYAEFGGGSEGFWYDLTKSDNFVPVDILNDPHDVVRALEAVETLKELELVYEQLTPDEH